MSSSEERWTYRIIDERDMPDRLDGAIRRSLCACFPGDRESFSRTRAWHGSHPAWSVFAEYDGVVIAHAGIVDRTILVGALRVRVGGLQNVFVLPEHRGRGLFRSLMATVHEEAQRRGYELGMLFCSRDIGLLYERVGWRFIERDVTRIDDYGRPQPLPDKNLTMIDPLSRSDLPPGDIHLQGNDW